MARSHALVTATTLLLSLTVIAPARAAVTLIYSSPPRSTCMQVPVMEVNGGSVRYYLIGDIVADSITVYDASTYERVCAFSPNFNGGCQVSGIRAWNLGDINDDNYVEGLWEWTFNDGRPPAVFISSFSAQMTWVSVWFEPTGAGYTVKYVGSTQGSLSLKLILEKTISSTEQELLVYSLDATDGVAEGSAPGGMQFNLEQNAPNPFRTGTSVHYRLGEPGRVSLRIIDVAGRLIRATPETIETAGDHVFQWDGTTDMGTPAGPGTYFYEVSVGGNRQSKRMVMLR
jgi:hypothetical protein